MLLDNVNLIAMLSLVLMAGVNVYLAVALIRGLRADDGVIERLASRTEYVIHEIARLARIVRSRSQPMAGEEQDETVVAAAAFEELQQSGFQEITEGSLDAYGLASELAELKDKEFTAWKEANKERIERLLAGQASLHKRLMDAQATLDASAQNLHALQLQNDKLSGFETQCRLLEDANHGLEIELSKLKNHSARTNAEMARVRLEAASAKKELVAHELRMKETHEKYMRDREQLITEKNVLEMRLNALQETFNRSVKEQGSPEQVQEAHAQFVRDSEALLAEKQQLEEKLAALQGDFDRTLVEKAFIESVLLDMDSALRYSKKAIPGGARARSDAPAGAEPAA